MAKLYYKFGAMGSSKTANALMVKFNYEEKGSNVWLIKPSTDNRDDYMDEEGNLISVIKSRIGLYAVANVVQKNDDIITLFCNQEKDGFGIDAIICDECQFLTECQVEQLKWIAEYQNIPVLCFGLRSDFQTKMFPGSKRLFELADSISEIKSVCKCGKKAIVNARFNNQSEIITDGEQIDIGGNEKYEGMCWKCWREAISSKSKK